jgi:hypothetical protein
LQGGAEEDEVAELSSPTYQIAPAFAKMREQLSLTLPDGPAQAELVMAVNEAERQLRSAIDELGEVKSSQRSLLDRVAGIFLFVKIYIFCLFLNERIRATT